MKKAFHNNIVFRISWPIIYGALIYLLILLLNNTLDDLSTSFFSQELLFTVVLTFVVFEFNRLTILSASKYKGKSVFWKIFLIIFASIIVTGLFVTLLVFVYFKVFLNYGSINSFLLELNIFLFIYLSTSLVYSSIVVGNQYLFKENLDLIEHEKRLAENLELELIKFQNDVNPALFYDSLEALISLLHKDPFEAEDYIDRLALVYRHILSNKNAELTNINSELETSKNIVALLNEKHANQITLTSAIPQEQNSTILVIPGVITNIVESIIRNSIITPILPLEIFVEIESNDYFVIRHKLNERLQPEMENHINDIQRAYSIFEKPIVAVRAYGEHFVKIPILQMEESLESSQAI